MPAENLRKLLYEIILCPRHVCDDGWLRLLPDVVFRNTVYESEPCAYGYNVCDRYLYRMARFWLQLLEKEEVEIFDEEEKTNERMR